MMQAHKNKMSPSPDKSTAGRLHLSPSPAKHSENANRASEDRKCQSPPKKFSSPSRTSLKKTSPSKSAKPFGQPIEIIKSKLQLQLGSFMPPAFTRTLDALRV